MTGEELRLAREQLSNETEIMLLCGKYAEQASKDFDRSILLKGLKAVGFVREDVPPFEVPWLRDCEHLGHRIKVRLEQLDEVCGLLCTLLWESKPEKATAFFYRENKRVEVIPAFVDGQFHFVAYIMGWWV